MFERVQNSGFTIVAEKLNFYRYLSHFRAVHRGAFFTEMRTTSVRRLLPEAWGKAAYEHKLYGALVCNNKFKDQGVKWAKLWEMVQISQYPK